jgi:hypothetical protein
MGNGSGQRGHFSGSGVVSVQTASVAGAFLSNEGGARVRLGYPSMTWMIVLP